MVLGLINFETPSYLQRDELGLLGLLKPNHRTLALVTSLGPALVQYLSLALILSGGGTLSIGSWRARVYRNSSSLAHWPS